jgi:hypothetical protein
MLWLLVELAPMVRAVSRRHGRQTGGALSICSKIRENSNADPAAVGGIHRPDGAGEVAGQFPPRQFADLVLLHESGRR